MRYGIFMLLCAMHLALSASAIAHVMESPNGYREGFGSCAKGPCMRKTAWNKSIPHHHHGKNVVVGSYQHTKDCYIR